MATGRDYNLQPYSSDGDTTGFRNIEWFKVRVFEPLDLYLAGMEIGSKKAIDIGCGNGRLILEIASRFDKVWAIDPVCDVFTKFIDTLGSDFSFQKCHLEEFNESKNFDALFFLGSFTIIYRELGEKIFHYIQQLLSENGVAIVTNEARRDEGYKLLELAERNGFERSGFVTSDSTTNVGILWKKR